MALDAGMGLWVHVVWVVLLRFVLWRKTVGAHFERARLPGEAIVSV